MKPNHDNCQTTAMCDDYAKSQNLSTKVQSWQSAYDLSNTDSDHVQRARPPSHVSAAIERHPIVSREAWLDLRVRDVTASDVAAICGLDPYRSPLRVWAEKTGAIASPPDNPVFRRGRWLEAAVIEALREERPSWDLRRAGVYLRDPTIRLGATPDAVAFDPKRDGIGAVQCKTVRREVFERDWTSSEPGVAVAPLHYQLQTLTEAMLIEASWASVVALVIDSRGGVEFVEAPVQRHAGAEARIRESVQAFWADLEAGRQPPLAPYRDGDVVSSLFRRSEPGQVLDLHADPDLPLLLARRARRKFYIKAAEEHVGAIETELKAKLGSHEAASLPGWAITWKTQRRSERLTPAWEGRVLRISAHREVVR